MVSINKVRPCSSDFSGHLQNTRTLGPRKAPFGGCTNAKKLYLKVESNEKIGYHYHTSLYPIVQVKKQYPIGHPKIIFKNFDSIDNNLNFVKCTVLSLRILYNPVLP